MLKLKPNNITKTLTPSFCCFGIVDECMFRCKMCFKWQDDAAIKGRKPVSFEAWQKAIESLKKIVPKPEEFVINFGGGEALLRDDLLELVRYASGQGFTTNIASNGWLIDDTIAQKIATSGLRSINLSLDSLREHVHDELRGKPGACEKVLQAIQLLRKYSSTLEIGICTVIYDTNIDDIISLARWVNKNKALNWIVFMAAMQPNNTVPEPRWFEGSYSYLWPKKKRKVQWLLTQLKWRKWWGWKIQNPYYQLNAFYRYFTHPERFIRSCACNMEKAVHVSATGDIFLCFHWASVGNIACDDLARCWNSPEAERVRSDIETCKENCHFLLNCYYEKEYPFTLKRLLK
jgi:MoaA/NifB/PqqE/SkfB family radical SAM enzyme